MAARRKRRARRSKKTSEYPPVVWMLFGLAIGLAVAFAVYVNDRTPGAASPQSPPQPASLKNVPVDSVADNVDHNSEVTANAETEAPADSKRFTFYDILPNFEVITPDEEPDLVTGVAPRAIEEPGVYILQAGSFSTNQDADRRRAELALQGIESRIQRVKVNDRNYHRVYIGPIEDLDELNLMRSRLRSAKIDVLRIRISD